MTETRKSEKQEAGLLYMLAIHIPYRFTTKIFVIHLFAEVTYHDFRKETNCYRF